MKNQKSMYIKQFATLAILLCTASALFAADGVEALKVNPQQVAILHWYGANQAPTSFTAGAYPVGVAFDGSSIWVANAESNNVMKFRASDGTLLGTFPVGTTPQNLVYDGANMWVSNYGGTTVTKLQGSTGDVLGTYTVGAAPLGMAFDGTYIWVAN